MNGQDISLHPFPSTSPLPDIKIACGIARHHKLSIRYEILGRIQELVIPSPADIPARKKGLWEEMCLELFLGVRNSPRYWEFNLSPSGHWNVFRFDAYREGMEEEKAFPSLLFSIHRLPQSLLLDLKFDLDKIIPANQPLQAAVSAVIKKRDGEVSYWAPVHCGPQPDFHCRDSFIIEL
jgi:hypothetical protein